MTANNLAGKHAIAFSLTGKNAWLLWCCQLLNVSTLLSELSTWMISIIVLCLGWQAI
jgi:hypothetical protein